MRRCSVLALTALMMAIVPGSARAQRPPLKTVMQEKADNAQALLKPVVLGDFASIERYATRLGHLTYTEVASWQDRPNSEYLQQARDFMQAIEDLGRATDVRDGSAPGRLTRISYRAA